MKLHSFIAGILSLMLIFETGSCVSLEDRTLSRQEADQVTVIGTVKDTFVSFQPLHIPFSNSLKRKAYTKLLEKAQADYGPNVDIRNIVITGSISGFEFLKDGLALGIGAGIGALTTPSPSTESHYSGYYDDYYYYEESTSTSPISYILGGAGIGLGIGLASGNFQKITAVGEVISSSGVISQPRTTVTGTGREGVYIGIISFGAEAEARLSIWIKTALTSCGMYWIHGIKKQGPKEPPCSMQCIKA